MKHTFLTWLSVSAFLFAAATCTGAEQAGPAPDELFKQLDANNDNVLDPDEIPADRARFFDRLVRVGDQDENGRLTKDEFLDALNRNERPGRGPSSGEPDRRRRGRGLDVARAEAFFDRLDENKDGKLEAGEVSDRGKRLVEAFLRRAGKQADESITKDEFVKMVKERDDAAGPVREGNRFRPDGRGPFRPPLFFRKLDADQDGKLSPAELANAAVLMEEFDRNHDGGLDVVELLGGGRPGDRPRDGESRRLPADGENPAKPEAKPEASERPEQPGSGPGSEAERRARFDKLDKNTDGKIDEGEAPERMKARFARIDKNNDGAVDLSEFLARGKKNPQDAKAKKNKKKKKDPTPESDGAGSES